MYLINGDDIKYDNKLISPNNIHWTLKSNNKFHLINRDEIQSWWH